MRIFISHSSRDAKIATAVSGALEANGHSCFIAPRDIKAGREYAEEIVNGIDGADILLLLLSVQSNQSPHVLREVERAGSSRIPIMVYKLEEVELTKSLEYFLMTNQWIDGTEDLDCSKVLEAFSNLSDANIEKCVSKQTDIGRERQGHKQSLSGGKHPFRHQREADTELVTNKQNKLNADGETRLQTQSKENTKKSVKQPKTESEQEKRRKNSGKTVALAIVTLLIFCGVTYGAARVWGGTKGIVSNSMAQGTENNDLSLGDSVELGSYEGEPIVWRVLHISEDGTQLILVSDKILTMKAFDAAESGSYNYDGDKDYWTTVIDPFKDADLEARVRGSNLWCDSNIRTWLNSERENVIYEDQAPAASAMSEKKNGYSSEAGFLHGFTKEELDVLRETEIYTWGNILISSEGIWTEDRVFLLSEDELDWFTEADVSIYTSPTDGAVAQDQTGWYYVQSLSFGVKEYIWLLRDPDFESASRCRAVSNGYQAEGIVLQKLEAGCEGYGIRPAVCVDRQALIKLLSSKK